MLTVSWASASDRSSAALTAGMAGRNRWIAIGPISEADASDRANSDPGPRASIVMFSWGRIGRRGGWEADAVRRSAGSIGDRRHYHQFASPHNYRDRRLYVGPRGTARL